MRERVPEAHRPAECLRARPSVPLGARLRGGSRQRANGTSLAGTSTRAGEACPAGATAVQRRRLGMGPAGRPPVPAAAARWPARVSPSGRPARQRGPASPPAPLAASAPWPGPQGARHTAWMLRSRCSYDMGEASTPYSGRLRGRAAGLMRPAGAAAASGAGGEGAAVRPTSRQDGRTPGRPTRALPRPERAERAERADDPPDPSLTVAVERQWRLPGELHPRECSSQLAMYR